MKHRYCVFILSKTILEWKPGLVFFQPDPTPGLYSRQLPFKAGFYFLSMKIGNYIKGQSHQLV